MSNRVYLTTTLPYVNADPHIGYALEAVQVDALARLHRLLGDEVFFNTGTDEHGLKIYQKAIESNQTPQAYTDHYAARFDHLKQALNLSYDNFIRTTDEDHIKSAQAFWRVCAQSGDIYKKEYQVKYCVGCELEKTDSELVAGFCPLHPSKPIELIEEENYFFRFSKYQEPLLKLYRDKQALVVPAHRLTEIVNFVEQGLTDFSISRLASKMPWGVPVPDDSSQVMYVWFDALVNYISAIGWPHDLDQFNKWWPVIQFAGKDNLRQQSAMWQAMLLSAGLPPSKQIMIHGFVNINGQKMSKSLGNVVNPLTLVDEYGTDALRYYLLRHITPFEDSNFTQESFREIYNANLANGLGNLVSRIMTLAETYLPEPVGVLKVGLPAELVKQMVGYDFNRALDFVWQAIGRIDAQISEQKPFMVIKTDKEEGELMIKNLVTELYRITEYLEAFLPETSLVIKNLILTNKKPLAPLFSRRD